MRQRVLESLAAWWQGLSRRQRVASVVLMSALLLALLLGISLSGSPRHHLLVEKRPGEGTLDVQSLMTLLEREGLSWHSRIAADGTVRVELAGLSDYRRAVLLAERHGFQLARGSSLDWLYTDTSSLTETREKFRARLDESREREIEASICWNSRIASAKLVLKRQPGRIFVGRAENPDSAAVALKLEPQVDRLSRREAGVIRDLVTGAFNIPPERIRIIDDRANSYPVPGTHDHDQEYRKTIQDVVEGLYLGQYKPWELRVGVLVDFSKRASSVDKLEYDREQSSDPRRLEAENRAAATPPGSNTRTRTEIPAGEIRDVRVNVVFDLKAVRRVLEERDTVLGKAAGTVGEERIEKYRVEQKLFVEGQLPTFLATVTVAVEAFSDLAVASPTAAGRGGPGVGGIGVDGGSTADAVLLYAPGVIGSLLLAGVLWRLLRGRSARQVAPATAAARMLAEQEACCATTLEAAQAAGQIVRERPDVAVSVLRLWLGGAGKPPTQPSWNDDLESAEQGNLTSGSVEKA